MRCGLTDAGGAVASGRGLFANVLKNSPAPEAPGCRRERRPRGIARVSGARGMTTVATKGTDGLDDGFDMVEAMDEAGCGDGDGLWHLLLADGSVAGCEDIPGAYLLARCLLEVVEGWTFDAAGRYVQLEATTQAPITPAAKSALARVRGVLKAARKSGVRFVLCYHVEGDPGWYMAWSAHFSKHSAAAELKDFLCGRMLWL